MGKLLFLCVFALTSVSVFAQGEVGKWSLHPQVGVTLNQWGMEKTWSTIIIGYTNETKLKAGWTAGAEVGYQMNAHLLLSAGVLYENLGVKGNGQYVNYQNTETGNYTWNESLSYVSVPLMANFYVLKGLALKCGVKPMLKVSASGVFKNVIKSTDLAIPIGVSYELPMGLILDAHYNLGLLNVYDNEMQGHQTDKYAFGKVHNHAFTLTVGYKFDL